jgi:hypothetical protein
VGQKMSCPVRFVGSFCSQINMSGHIHSGFCETKLALNKHTKNKAPEPWPDLHIGSLSLSDGAVKVSAGGESSGQALIDAA